MKNVKRTWRTQWKQDTPKRWSEHITVREKKKEKNQNETFGYKNKRDLKRSFVSIGVAFIRSSTLPFLPPSRSLSLSLFLFQCVFFFRWHHSNGYARDDGRFGCTMALEYVYCWTFIKILSLYIARKCKCIHFENGNERFEAFAQAHAFISPFQLPKCHCSTETYTRAFI